MTTRLLATVVLVAALLGGCLGVATDSPAPIDQSAPGRWVTLAPMPTARQEVAVAALGGHVWVIGGFGAGAEPLATVERYDPASNSWDARPPLPIAVHHAAAVAVGDRLFVLGGYTGGRIRWTPLDSVYEWSETRGTWQARVPMPTARGALAAVELNGRIHALGGSAQDPMGAHEVYDPTTSRWTVVNPMPTARDHLAAVVFHERIWVLGGRTSFTGTQYANVEVYDATTDSWRTGPPLPRGRGGLTAAALSDRILVFGGEAPFRIFNATEMYEPAGNRWIAKEPMPTPRHGAGAAPIEGRVYVVGGGQEPGFAATQVNEAYTP
ncbi:MAG TPA: kelch repeat-containing protein [Methylomirabilota bacterium]|jgi:N-acetylneuraminic acid mutarotase|nr:kelch repeat-containing protein [Methylomirabilota bacterium]